MRIEWSEVDSLLEFVSNHAVALALAAVVLLSAIAALAVSRARKTAKPEPTPLPGEPAPPPAPENSPATPEEITKLAEAAQNEDLAALLRSRMEDFEDEDSESEKAMILVGLLDEIQILTPSAKPADTQLLARCAETARQILRSMEAEAIDDDAWTPEHQRAIKVLRDLPAGSPPQIAEKVASGLILHGRIHRKQEVVLRMPE